MVDRGETTDANPINRIPLDAQVSAILERTGALSDLAEKQVSPVVRAKTARTLNEQALAGTYFRMALLSRTLAHLGDAQHFQVAAMVARTMFELLLDLKSLADRPDLTDQFFAFTRVNRFQKADQLADFLQRNPEIDPTPHRAAIRFAADAERRRKVETECEKYWGRTNVAKRHGRDVSPAQPTKGELRWPKHWSGHDMFRRERLRRGIRANVSRVEPHTELVRSLGSSRH